MALINNVVIIRSLVFIFLVLLTGIAILLRLNYSHLINSKDKNLFELIESELRRSGEVKLGEPSITDTITRKELINFYEKKSFEWDLFLDKTSGSFTALIFRDRKKVNELIKFRNDLGMLGYQDLLTEEQVEIFVKILQQSLMTEPDSPAHQFTLLHNSSDPNQPGIWKQIRIDLSEQLAEIGLNTPLVCFLSTRKIISTQDCNTLAEGIRKLDKNSRYFFVVSATPFTQDSRYYLKERVSRVFAYDLILIDFEVLFDLSISTNPGSLLRKLVISQLDLTRISPFTLNGPASEQMFFGREQELSLIRENINKNSYAIIGGRRIGKSSILVRLHKITLPAAGIYSVYIDLSTYNSYEEFLARKIPPFSPDLPIDFPSTFGELLDFHPGDNKPVICFLLDEADKIVRIDQNGEWKIFKALRYVANSGIAQMVLSGELSLREATLDPQSPLFNFTNPIILHLLEYGSVDALVVQSMKRLGIELVEKEEIINQIYWFTSGHPNIVQRLCHRLVASVNRTGTREITLKMVKEVTDDPAFRSEDFLSTVWESATPLEKIISLLLVENRKNNTNQKLKKAIEKRTSLTPRAKDIGDALQRLVDLRSILKPTPDGYIFSFSSFPDVVSKALTINDILSVRIDEYKEQNQ
jgi:hypothetical protein